jgi:flagellar hook-associated protein 1 FlgK
MGTISSAFSMISQSLDSDQSALNVIANNVANANTTGYTQEVPNWQQNSTVSISGTQYGTGATQTGPTSVRDRVLTERIDQQQQLASSSSTRLSALDTIQALFTPDSGSSSAKAGDIGSDLSSFFTSFTSLEANPSSVSLRESVLSSAQTLAADISGASSSLSSQRQELDQEASGVTSQVNALTTDIAQLNQQIQDTSPTADAGTLEDQREQDVNSLSKLVGVNQITTENNGLSIATTSGALLVSGGSSNAMSSGIVNGMTHFFVSNTDITTGLTTGGGELGGYLTARDTDIPSVMGSLDQLAYSVSTSVNNLNNTGTDLNGATGTVANPLYIFNEPTQVSGSAATMSVIMTDPSQISAAALGQGTGDNTNATAMATLSNTAIVNNQTPTNYFSTFVSELGATVSQVQTESTAQSASVTQLTTQNDSLSGVNLNDEASNMTTMERSYQSAAQVFTMLNNIINSALNLGTQTTVS